MCFPLSLETDIMMFCFHKENVKVSSDSGQVFLTGPQHGPAWLSTTRLMASRRYHSNEIVNPGTDKVERKQDLY